MNLIPSERKLLLTIDNIRLLVTEVTQLTLNPTATDNKIKNSAPHHSSNHWRDRNDRVNFHHAKNSTYDEIAATRQELDSNTKASS